MAMQLQIIKQIAMRNLLTDNNNIQLGAGTIEDIDDFVVRIIKNAITEIKQDKTIRRIDGSLVLSYVIANFKTKAMDNIDKQENKCPRCNTLGEK